MGGIHFSAMVAGLPFKNGSRCFFILTLVVAGTLGLGVTSNAVSQEVYVDPALSLPDDFVFTVDIGIDCAGLEVKGVEAVLAFDPTLLQLDAVDPGLWYTDMDREFFFYDYTPFIAQGTIHFASSVLVGSNDQAMTLAVCHFTALGFGSSPLDFLEVDVRNDNNVDLGFGHSTGDLIEIDQAISTTTTSFGLVKALFR